MMIFRKSVRKSGKEPSVSMATVDNIVNSYIEKLFLRDLQTRMYPL